MSGGRSSRTFGGAGPSAPSAGRAAAIAAAVAVSLTIGPAADAFEAFDGRVQLHGYFESTMRAMNADYSEDWDVTQWYQIFNLEIEIDLLRDTVGPIDLLSAFVRAEVRYDCVYSRGCGMFRSINTYGDRSKSLPRRLNEATRLSQAGRIRVPSNPDLPSRYSGSSTDPLTNFQNPVLSLFANSPGGDGVAPNPLPDETCADLHGGLCPYFAGADGVSPAGIPVAAFWPTADDPFSEMERFGEFGDFRWIAPVDKVGAPATGGPWLPKNFFKTNGTLASQANPFDDRVASYAASAGSYNSTLIAEADAYAHANPGLQLQDDPVALQAAISKANAAGHAARGSGALPYRPAPIYRENGARDAMGNLVMQAPNAGDSRGLFITSLPLANALNKGNLTPVGHDYNFSQAQRAWNRGASQRDEKELKEAYFDIETFDNRLWLRVGRQQVVWGKTELFRTTDQFNPTDAALASLPSLEESRIALWSVRGVWSFYEVGPIEDVRLELAFNFDDYQQTDIGACGEAYTPNITCGLTFGSFAHGLFGVGLVGIDEPDAPWQSLEGWEVGARLEWRYDRFSFALVDFWGYSDLPTVRQITTFTRNVDPRSGRPREIVPGSLSIYKDLAADPYTGSTTTAIQQIGTQGACLTGLEAACLTPTEPTEDLNRNGVLDPGEDVNGNGILDQQDLNQNGVIDDEALVKSPVSQQLFAFICGSTVAFTDLDRSACALNVFGSAELIAEDPIAVTVAQAISLLNAGSPTVSQSLSWQLNDAGTALVPAPIDQDGEGGADGLGGFILPLVQLSDDPGDRQNIVVGNTVAYRFNPNTNGQPVTGSCDDDGFVCGGPGGLVASLTAALANQNPTLDGEGMGNTLNPEQEALLGCGPFWGTQCDTSGIDLMNAEGSAIFMSWPGVEGTNQNNDPNIIWFTNERNALGTRFLNQPGTREWYYGSSEFSTAIDPGSGLPFNDNPLFTRYDFDNDGLQDPNPSPVSHLHSVGPLCTTSNFGGALYASGDDSVNGNQDVLPGCRRKWKTSPKTAYRVSAVVGGTSTLAFTGSEPFAAPGNPNAMNPDWLDTPTSPGNLRSLNFYGQDETCAAEISANGSATPACQYLEDYLLGDATQKLKDPRSWDYIRDGNPDGLGIGGFTELLRTTSAGNSGRVRPADGTPDFFYRSQPFANPFPQFDSCNPALYPQSSVIAAGGSQFVPCGRGGHPMTGAPWASEIAALSWNFMVQLIYLELTAEDGPLLTLRAETPACGEPGADPNFCSDYDVARATFLDPSQCSIATPELCETFRTLMGVIGVQRNVRRAGGNAVHGRRTFVWHSGGEGVLEYEKRNVLGFSSDFADDWSKANFSMEFTWIEGVPVTSTNQYDGLSRVDNFNLTLSVDRPTFINFLNANRTFFFNAQFFTGYTSGWEKGMTGNGPWNFLGTLAVSTGYFQDRLTPSIVSVYDVKSQSGAVLTSIGYRFTQNFSAAVGMAFFYGKPDFTDEPTAGLAPAGNRSYLPPDDLYKSVREPGLAIVRDRDEVWARVRYTF